MHFDEAETWKTGSTFDLFSVALHEAGHGLGLNHSANTSAVMYAYYKMVTGLHHDDINGIQSIYAAVYGPIPDIKANGSQWAVNNYHGRYS